MILIADSGSTKTEWRTIGKDGKISQFRTDGLNPYFTDAHQAKALLMEQLLPQMEAAVEKIYFYGAGCRMQSKKDLVRDWLKGVFPATQVEVESDMLGAARALCGGKQGIAVILGTGSNSCLSDGKNITSMQVSLGYILGDEGSGNHLGKMLLRSFFNNELPSGIADAFNLQFGLTLDEALEHVYRKPFPNRYLASFAPFVFRHRNNPVMSKKILEVFDEFVVRYLLRYDGVRELPVHFTGSIAYYFVDFLRASAEKHHFKIGTVTESPAAGLSLYHQSTMS